MTDGKFSHAHEWELECLSEFALSTGTAPITANGKVIAFVVTENYFSGGKEELIANARRIVACVNACAGLGTDNLENNIPLKEGLHGLNQRIRDAEAQSDTLLAALRRIADGSFHDQFEVAELAPYMREIARAAIASVEGKS